MREAVDSVGKRDVGAGERPLVRRDEVQGRAVELPQERRRHLSGTGLHEDRLGDHRGAIRIGGVHPRIDREQRHPLPVNGDLELLGVFLGVQRSHGRTDDGAAHLMVQGNPENVVPVRGEGVVRGEPAAGAVRRSLDLAALRSPPGDEVAGLGRRGVRIAHREPADLARRAQVGIHQRRREQLHVRDVVEVGADGVLRQVLRGVELERQQVPDRRRVLRPVQSLEGAAPRIRLRRGTLVELGLKRPRDFGEHFLGGTA